MKIEPCVTIDFETHAIESRPEYPPKPVGLAIGFPGNKPVYYAWGHCGEEDKTQLSAAKKALKEAWRLAKRGDAKLLFHNAKFDIDVAETHMECDPVTWDMFHDTQFLLFLHDPHAPSLALKPASEALLGIKPDERDKVKEWILANVPEAAKKPSTWGVYMWRAPSKLVRPYAIGDVTRTAKLFSFLYPKILKAAMGIPYDRERKLLPIFLENERRGIRVDVTALKRDIPLFHAEMAKAEKWLRTRLKVPELNIDSDAAMAKALDEAKVVTEWSVTKTGKKSTSKKSMTIEKFNDKKVFYILGYRNRLATCLRMFMEPWLVQAEKSGGLIQPNWNQVRQPKGEDGSKGTRTGRPSCDDPNLLNIAKSFEDRGDDYTHPKFLTLRPLPLIREYLLPDKGCTWLHRDYNQQELRILAHFEDGAIMKAYKENPDLDIHTFVQSEIKRITHLNADRVSVKTMNFGKIYGQGLGSLAEKLRRPIDEVRLIRDAQNKALPGLPDLENSIKTMARAGKPIFTWGGRVYYVEPPKYVEKFGREMTFEYKLLNYLIQGSAADATKEAIIRYYNHPDRKGRLLVTVYDEINVCAPSKFAKQEMKILQECMEGLAFDVPMITDGKSGERWGKLEKSK